MALRPFAELARECVTRLEEQSRNLDDAHARLTGMWASVFENECKHLGDYISDLRRWEEDVGDATGSDENSSSDEANRATRAVTDTLALIRERATAVGNILQPGRDISTLSDDDKNTTCQRLCEVVKQVKGSIETLQSSSIVLGSRGKRQRKAEIETVRHEFDKRKQYFVNKIRHLPVKDRRDTFSVRFREFKVRFETLDFFWQNLPKLNKKIDSGDLSPDPFDGCVISESAVAKARTVLVQFKDAWWEANDTLDTQPTDDKLNKLDQLPKVALVLSLTGKRSLFNKFIEAEIYDADMDRDPFRPGQIDLGPDADFIGAQYSRTRDPQWHDGGHLELNPYESLPLRRVTSIKSRKGGYSYVFKVDDLWFESKTNQIRSYACKEMIAEHGARLHIKTEIDNLKDLSKEAHGHHLVKYVKSYERSEPGEVIMGVLLDPFADLNLNDLLKHYCAYPAEREKHRSSLLLSLGCLTYSLCYLHNVKFYRHRDIKPQNILYVNDTGEFMWSDFGLAYKFHGSTDSKTHDPNFRATLQYEAPEVGKKQPSEGGKKEIVEHGRSSDVFSLGCVFLEIISVLLPPLNAPKTAIPFQTHYPYKDHISSIEQWIEKSKNVTRDDKLLNKLLDISSQMVKENPRERLKVGKVAEALAKLRDSNNNPLFCKSCVEKYRRDSSRHDYIHKDIFKHKKWTGDKIHTTLGDILEKVHLTSPTTRKTRA